MHRFALLTCAATLALIGLGGLVTSHGVGMAVPDWPSTYGYNMFYFPFSHWVGGIFYEHSHRLWASLVGFLTLILAVWAHGRRSAPLLLAAGGCAGIGGTLVIAFAASYRGLGLQLLALGVVSVVAGVSGRLGEPSSPRVRTLAKAALALVIAQGVLGGMRVVLFRDAIGIVHATVAHAFLLLIAMLALLTSKHWHRPVVPGSLRVDATALRVTRRWVAAGCVLIFAQLVLGASMRHQHAGLAVPDFPLAYGRVWPPTDDAFLQRVNASRIDARDYNPITATQIRLHMTHRIGAFAALTAVALAAISARKLGRSHRWCRRATATWFGLLVAQAGLGAATVWTAKAADIATAHVVLGAVGLVWGVLTGLLAKKFSIEPTGAVVHADPAFSTSGAAVRAGSAANPG